VFEWGNKIVIRELLVVAAAAGVIMAAALGVAPTTGAQQSCDSNYAGTCVPVASDVDCEGGSGNGPADVSGPVTVVGVDIYKLDNDGNGIGCE
jgi:hypothetical protein